MLILPLVSVDIIPKTANFAPVPSIVKILTITLFYLAIDAN